MNPRIFAFAAAHVGVDPTPKIVLQENVREQLRRRRGLGRFAAGLMKPQ